MKTKILVFLLAFSSVQLFAQPADAVQPDWKKGMPTLIYPCQDLVSLYEKTCALAAARVRKGPQGLAASPYLDENCYDDQIWIWDSCFMVLFAKYAPDVYPGAQTLDNLYYPIHDSGNSPLIIHLRDNPPLFSWVEYANYLFTGDKQRIERVLLDKQYLQRHYRYFNKVAKGDVSSYSPNPIYRDVVKDASGQIIGYTWTGGASGMDNTVRGRDAGGYDKILWIDAISQQALSALYISRLCNLVGQKKEQKEWLNEYKRLKKLINDRYWDEKDGFYYDINIDNNEPCRIKTPASFWAMLAEIPSKKQAERMVEYLKSEDFLGGQFPWTSLSRDDKDHDTQTGNYWRGGVWLPIVYMGTKALEKYGFYELADTLAEKVINQQLRTFNEVYPHTVWECYSPSANLPSTELGNRVRPDFCGWSALGPISLLIENVMGFREVNALNKQIVWDIKPEKGTYGIKNLRFGNIHTSLIYHKDNNCIEVESNAPYTLLVNGKKRQIKAGKNKLSYK